MAIINTNGGFGPTDTVTNTNLNAVADAATFNDPVDEATLELYTDGKLRIKASGVGTTQIAPSSVTKAKIENVANMKVLGNTSGSATAPQEVNILDEDDMSSDSSTALATQQSIKAYVDGGGGFSPSAYTGEESVTLPNGLIMKWGTMAPATGTNTITFSTAFPTSCLNIQYSRLDPDDSTYDNNESITSKSTANFTIVFNNGPAYGDMMWQAIGY